MLYLFISLSRSFVAFAGHLKVLTVMSDLLSRSGRLLVPHCQAAVAGLPGVWNATSSQTPLRCKCLQVREREDVNPQPNIFKQVFALHICIPHVSPLKQTPPFCPSVAVLTTVTGLVPVEDGSRIDMISYPQPGPEP